MSFGFGVGDFLAVGTLVYKVYDAYKEAPEQFKCISGEIASLSSIVANIEKQIDHPGFYLDPRQIDELKALVQGLREVFSDLDSILTKYKSLESGSGFSRAKDRVQFGREDLAALRARLVSNATMLTAFNSTLTNHQIAELQTQLTEIFPHLRRNGTAASLSSISTLAANTDNNDALKQLCDELNQSGVTADMIKRKKDEVLAVFQKPTVAAAVFQNPPVATTATLVRSSSALTGESTKRSLRLNIDWEPLNRKSGPLLLEAAIAGDLQGVKARLKRPGNIDYSGVPSSLVNPGSYFPRTALMWASYKNHLEVVRLLLEKGANVHAKNEKGKDALQHAADEGHLEVVQLLLYYGANIHAANTYGNNALHHAAWSGHVDVAKLLLLRGASIDDANNDGRTALHWAAQEGKLRVLQLLLDMGANINAGNKFGNNALHHASWGRSVDIVQALLDKGADIHSGNFNKDNALHWASQEGKVNIAELLLKNGANINSVNIRGNTSLHKAVLKNHIEVVRLLLQMGAKANCTNNNGENALHWAAQEGKTGIVRLLVEMSPAALIAGCINVENGSGNSALDLAAKAGHLEIVQLLVSRGASIVGGGRGKDWKALGLGLGLGQAGSSQVASVR